MDKQQHKQSVAWYSRKAALIYIISFVKGHMVRLKNKLIPQAEETHTKLDPSPTEPSGHTPSRQLFPS